MGRTGAGKSSLIAALFRLAEPEGLIQICGRNASQMRLYDLRKNMSIIPQEPILFSGTVRKNLDPFGDFTDESIWKSLHKVKLKLHMNKKNMVA